MSRAFKNISDDTQGTSQSRHTASPRHHKKERWTCKDKLNATYKTTYAQKELYAKEAPCCNGHAGVAGWVGLKDLNQFKSGETSYP